jgi:5-formyltetrahydrofolate cyclo-ligase
MLVQERKALLRQACRDVVRGKAPAASFRRDSDWAQAHFLKECPARAGLTVALYHAVRGEVGTETIRDAYLSAGAVLCYPAVVAKGTLAFFRHLEGDAWEAGPYCIPEPPRHPAREVRPDAFDLVLVPGIAFDRRGRRLGHGHGYYDRFLADVPGRALRVGLGFSHQVVHEVPVDAWDIPVHMLVTEEGVMRFAEAAGSPGK